MILLDTHAAIWYGAGIEVKPPALERIHHEIARDDVVLSTISAWEIGMLARKGRLVVPNGAAAYTAALFAGRGIRSEPVTTEIAILAADLPSEFHGDPADRIIVATARLRSAVLVTRDERILRYAASTGFVMVLAY